MMNPFYYRQIGDSFFQEVCDKVSRGESTILLAPRFGGSRYALFRLHGILREKEVAPIVYVRLARHDEANSSAAIRELVDAAVRQAAGGFFTYDENADAPDALLDSVDRLHIACSKPVVLIMANVDYLPYHLTGRLLAEVRTLDQSGKVIALLSGEDTFYDLVYGPNSEFNCTNQLVLQNLDLDEFSRFARLYFQSLQIETPNSDVVRAIWSQTGGNRHLLRILLWELLERRSRGGGDSPLGAADIHPIIASSRLPGPYGAEIFRHQLRLIAHEPRCWMDLKTLLREGFVDIIVENGPPTPLELAGVTLRNASTLTFSSPWMAEYIRLHFDDKRWGDLYTRKGDWKQAFAHYSRVGPDEMARPSTAEDRLEVEINIRSLSAALYAEMHSGTKAVRKLFVRGCRYILGFQEVAFWTFRHGKWSLELSDEPSQHGSDHPREAAKFLPAGGYQGTGIISMPDPWRKLAIAATFLGLRFDQRQAVVLSDFRRQTFISRERERLTHELIEHFLKAYSHALSMERDRERLTVRNKHVEVMNNIFSALGSQVLNVNNALAFAAQGLRKLGYSRVLFCLVNPTGDRIQGELDDSDDPRFNVAKMTDWPLDPPRSDLQPYVIFTRMPKIVEDARREPLANLQVVHSTEMKALALVPILSQEEAAIGTIHVERKDGAVPSDDEVEDLLQFGKQLAIAIEQSERVNLLQTALDKIPEPVLIADRVMRPRFLNVPAAELLGLQAGWHDRNQSPVLSEKTLGTVGKLLSNSLDRGQRLVRQIHEVKLQQTYRGVALADAISDWKGRTVGALLHVQDLNYLYKVLEAFRLIAEANDTGSAMRSMLQATYNLGHQRGRLFLVDEGDPERLVGRFTLSQDGEIVEDAKTQNEVVLPRRRDPGFWTWRCIEERTPIVFCWKPDQEDGATIVTSFGLEAINSNPPKCPREQDKNTGDFWIDFPLVTRQEVLGKLSLSCDPSLKPEDFHLLRMLSEMSTGLLDAFLRREHMLQDVEDKVLGPAAEQTMAVAAHNIATRLASLPILLARYRKREQLSDELSALNDDFEHTLGEVLRIIRRIKERLASVKAEIRRVDLLKIVEGALRGALSHHQWCLHCDSETLDADVDPDLLENALLELVQNSREMIEMERDLFIRVNLDIHEGKDYEWVRISYADNGPGIPDNLKIRIFDPFFSRRPGRKISSGLGLTFVQRVLSAHDGAILETGSQGAGAHFVLTFPRFNGTL